MLLHCIIFTESQKRILHVYIYLSLDFFCPTVAVKPEIYLCNVFLFYKQGNNFCDLGIIGKLVIIKVIKFIRNKSDFKVAVDAAEHKYQHG